MYGNVDFTHDSAHFSSGRSSSSEYSDHDSSESPPLFSQLRTTSVSSDEGYGSFCPSNFKFSHEGQSASWSDYNSKKTWSNGVNSDEEQPLSPLATEYLNYRAQRVVEQWIWDTAQDIAKLLLLESKCEQPKLQHKQSGDAMTVQQAIMNRQARMYQECMMLQRQSNSNNEWSRKSYAQVHGLLCDIVAPGTRPGDRVLVHQDRQAARKVNRNPRKAYCEFCFNNHRAMQEKNGKPAPSPTDKGSWSNHVCKAPNGDVICPVLFTHICKECKATGKKAHTIRYCSSRQQRQFEGNQKKV